MSALNNINLNGGDSQIYSPTGFSYSGMIADKETSIFVKCQIIALWFIVVLIVIMGIIGHKRAQHRPEYKKMNPISKTLESAAEGFEEMFRF